MNNHISIKGTKTPKSRRKTKQQEKGRVCSNDNCEQVLSVYNKNKQCFLHAPKKTPRVRGAVAIYDTLEERENG